eukprot:208635_1
MNNQNTKKRDDTTAKLCTSNISKKKRKIKLIIKKKNESNKDAKITNMITQLQNNISQILSRIKPLNLNANICDVEKIKRVSVGLSIHNVSMHKPYLLNQIETLQTIGSLANVNVLLDAYNKIIGSSNLHNLNIYYNHENKVIKFQNDQQINDMKSVVHKFNRKANINKSPKNFDRCP